MDPILSKRNPGRKNFQKEYTDAARRKTTPLTQYYYGKTLDGGERHREREKQ